MSDKSGIQWTDATWNPVTGCTKVSQGCKHCYAETLWPRLAQQENTVYTGRPFTDVQCHPQRLVQPLRWARPRVIFVNSMSDLFHEDVPDDFIAKVFAVMAMATDHTFQILTKRPERMRALLSDHEFGSYIDHEIGAMPEAREHHFRYEYPLTNVWLGVSVENQATADERIPLLLETPAAVRFISAEPLLGAVDLEAVRFTHRQGYFGDALQWHHRPRCFDAVQYPGLDWVIAGGESGPKARPCHPDWIRSLRDQCAAADVPFWFKQWGAWVPWSDRNDPTLKHRLSGPTSPPGQFVTRKGQIHRKGPKPEGAVLMSRLGKKTASNMLDGQVHEAAPAVHGL